MSRTSSVQLPRAGASSGPRILRLRGDEHLEQRLHPGQGSEAARLQVSSRETVELDEEVRIEISFGPLKDEVELDGRVAEVLPHADGRPPRVLIAFARDQAPRLRYVRQVLAGNRHATARSHRRVPVDLEVRWRLGRAHYASRISDLSRGGAFIISRCLPDVGSRVEVEILADDRSKLHFDAVVSWVRGKGGHTGFGVNFKLPSRDAAAALTDVVRQEEQRVGLPAGTSRKAPLLTSS